MKPSFVLLGAEADSEAVPHRSGPALPCPGLSDSLVARGPGGEQSPATRNRTRDHLIAAKFYSQTLYQLSYSRLVQGFPQLVAAELPGALAGLLAPALATQDQGGGARVEVGARRP